MSLPLRHINGHKTLMLFIKESGICISSQKIVFALEKELTFITCSLNSWSKFYKH